MANAWHLRQDGVAYPVKVHMYPEEDENLDSEAEIASFLLYSESCDIYEEKFLENVIFSWLTFLISDDISYDCDEYGILSAVRMKLRSLPYSFNYPLTEDEYVDIFTKYSTFQNVNDIYDYCDSTSVHLEGIWSKVSDIFNQKFCRVRFGGQYDTHRGNNTLWFRIGSVNYNWDNTIYMFVSEMKNKLHVTHISICRDAETDFNQFTSNTSDLFYIAKDGSMYYDMPIDEFLSEEHEYNPVFAAESIGLGVKHYVKSHLAQGKSFYSIYCSLKEQGNIHGCFSMWTRMREHERSKCVIMSSEWLDSLNTWTKNKMFRLRNMIVSEIPAIDDVDIEFTERENSKGKLTGFELLFTIESHIKLIDGLQVGIVSNRELSNSTVENLFWKFKSEYDDTINFRFLQK